ncbi:hypothetical protein L2E82_47639 [Cichorium intybus]|uniref:Uncharacterized protein n=1 Tax=Cichorium intybus TaxID=13427 RepID=A0ACB8YWB7_CICIN|nr:hypothetical protein L2E82_47639 [Cichorium intybus]
MHACNSRHLGLFHKESDNQVDVTSKTQDIIAGLEGRNVTENNMEEKESKFEFHSDEQKMHAGYDLMMFAGSDINVQISQDGTKIEGWSKNHVRSTMESKQKDSKEKINSSNDNSVTEDVGVMDYAQPHRKPPIHNLQP